MHKYLTTLLLALPCLAVAATLGTMSLQNKDAVDITGGAIAGAVTINGVAASTYQTTNGTLALSGFGSITGTLTGSNITDGTITDADINASAAIALSKLATTGTMTATTFVGALTGNVTGNASGSAGSVAVGGITGASASAITWLTTPTEANLKTAQSGLAWLDTANAFSAANTTTLTGLGTTPTAAFSLINSTAAALGAQQASPSLLLQGHGWRSGNSTDHTLDFQAYVLPVQGSSANPTGAIRFQARTDAGAFTDVFAVDNVGGVTIPDSANVTPLSLKGGTSATTGFALFNSNMYFQVGGTVAFQLTNGAGFTALGGILLPATGGLCFSGVAGAGGAPNSIITQKGTTAGTIQLGADANGTPVNQTLTVASGITGTDKPGANLTVDAGNVTGAGTPGNIILRTATAGTTGTTVGTYTTRMTVSPSGVTIGASGSAIPSIVYGTGAVNFASMAAGTEDVQTITVTGATTTSTVAANWSAALEGGIVIKEIWVSGSNTVSIRALNSNTVSTVDPASITGYFTIINQ